MAWRNVDIDQLLTADLLTRCDNGRDSDSAPHWGPSQDRMPADKDVSGHPPPAEQSHTTNGSDAHIPGSPSALSSNAEQIVRLAAQDIADLLRAIDREARHAGRTIPTIEERDAVASIFWEAMRGFAAIDQRVRESERIRCATAARNVLQPWLLRSSYWSRSCLKPHGYAGDFRMLEWMYDLESDPCADPTKPAIVNLLDYLYSTVHSVRAVWHRRRWYAERIHELRATTLTNQPVRILDLACGGSRYTRDSIPVGHNPDGLELTLLDQDPAALAFVDSWLPDRVRGSTRLICGPVRDVRRLMVERARGARGGFDLVISTGLFDYLDDPAAKQLLAEMVRLARPGGLVAVCNFAPADASRIVKDWIVGWPLIYRDASALRELVPDGHAVAFDRSPDGGLVYALVWAPGRRHPAPDLGGPPCRSAERRITVAVVVLPFAAFLLALWLLWGGLVTAIDLCILAVMYTARRVWDHDRLSPTAIAPVLRRSRLGTRNARDAGLDGSPGRGDPLGRTPPQAPRIRRRGRRPPQPAHDPESGVAGCRPRGLARAHRMDVQHRPIRLRATLRPGPPR